MLPPGILDMSTLKDEDIGHFEFVVNSPSYQRIVRLYLLTMVRSVERLMKDPSKERKDKYSNDFLAGQAVALEGLVAFLDGLRAQTNMNRMAVAQQAMTPEQEYNRLRELGLVRHTGQATAASDVQAMIDQALAEQDY